MSIQIRRVQYANNIPALPLAPCVRDGFLAEIIGMFAMSSALGGGGVAPSPTLPFSILRLRRERILVGMVSLTYLDWTLPSSLILSAA
jgi:hypothetical protein